MYVKHRICSGCTPSRSKRATLSIKTFVLPDPAFAVSHDENLASDAVICALVAEFTFIKFQLHIYRMCPIRHNVIFDRMGNNLLLQKEHVEP